MDLVLDSSWVCVPGSGRSFLGGMFEALNSLRKIKNPKQLKDIVESLGLITDSAIYDIAGRYQVGDNMSKGWTRTQRIFFKLNFQSFKCFLNT